MPFHNPIPESRQPAKSSGGLGSLVEAEKLMQIAMVMPSAVLVGWGLGYLGDHKLHLRWMTASGVIFGCVAGLVYVIQLAFAAERASQRRDTSATGQSDGSSGSQP